MAVIGRLLWALVAWLLGPGVHVTPGMLDLVDEAIREQAAEMLA